MIFVAVKKRKETFFFFQFFSVFFIIFFVSVVKNKAVSHRCCFLYVCTARLLFSFVDEEKPKRFHFGVFDGFITSAFSSR